MATPPRHRGAIVRAAATLFRRNGYAATGINEIAEVSGAPKGSLYHYFPNGKDEIAEAAVRFAGAGVVATLEKLEQEHDTAAAIKTWLSKFSPGTHSAFIGLRGTQPQINAAQAAAHVLVAEDGGRTHSSQVLLYGPDNYAHVAFIYNNANEAKQMAHDVAVVASS